MKSFEQSLQEKIQAKIVKASDEAVISFKRSWKLALCRAMKSFKWSLKEKLQTKLVKASGETKILALQ